MINVRQSRRIAARAPKEEYQPFHGRRKIEAKLKCAQKLKMFPSKGNTSDVSDVHSTNDGTQEQFPAQEHIKEFPVDGKTDEQQAEEFPVEKIEEFPEEKIQEIPVEKIEEFPVDGKTKEQQIEEFPVEEFRAEESIVKETGAVRDEIGCIYQKLLDGKDRFASTDESSEFKDILTEAQNLIARLKGTPGNIEEVEMFDLLCHTVEEMYRRPDEQKLHMEEYAHNLTMKFNLSTGNSGNTSVAKLQVVSVGKEISRYFSRAPTTKFVLGALDTEEGEMTTQISDLPDEILRYIFLMLSRGDRKIVVLVSRWWRTVGECPVLWRWSAINIHNAGDVKKLAAGRIKHVQKISVNPLWHIWQAQPLQKLFRAILKLPKLKEVENMELMDLGSVRPDLLARAFVKFEKLFMYDTTTTNDQRVAIFKEMAENTKINNLTMVWINLIAMELDAGVLAKAISGLKLVELRYVSLTNDQAEKLFKSISENDQLNSVSMTSLNLSSVGPEIFGSALAKVETLSLRYMAVSTEQSESLFREMNRNSKMKSIAITEIDVSAADPKLLARVLSALVQINLTSNKLTNEQVRSFFSKMKQNCKLNFLNLSHNDLSHVDADDLATVVNNIEEVDLNYTNLSTDQIKDILRRAQHNTKLKKLSILGNRILEVDPDTINRAKEIIDELNIDSESNLQDDESYIELIG